MKTQNYLNNIVLLFFVIIPNIFICTSSDAGDERINFSLTITLKIQDVEQKPVQGAIAFIFEQYPSFFTKTDSTDISRSNKKGLLKGKITYIEDDAISPRSSAAFTLNILICHPLYKTVILPVKTYGSSTYHFFSATVSKEVVMEKGRDDYHTLCFAALDGRISKEITPKELSPVNADDANSEISNINKIEKDKSGVKTIATRDGGILNIVFSTDGKKIAACGKKNINLFDNDKESFISSIPWNNELRYNKCEIVFSEKDDLVVWEKEKGMSFYDAESGRIKANIVLPPCFWTYRYSRNQNDYTVLCDNESNLLISSDNYIRGVQSLKIDLENKKAIKKDLIKLKGVYDFFVSKDGKTLATLANISDKKNKNVHEIKLYNISDKKLIQSYSAPTQSINSIAFSEDNKLLAVGTYEGDIILLNITDKKENKLFSNHSPSVISLKFSPDGKLLASGGGDNTVKLWRVSDGKLLKSLEGHTWQVNAVAFSPDGKTLASGSADGTIKLWNIEGLEKEPTEKK